MCSTNMLPVAALKDKCSLTVSAGDKRKAIQHPAQEGAGGARQGVGGGHRSTDSKDHYPQSMFIILIMFIINKQVNSPVFDLLATCDSFQVKKCSHHGSGSCSSKVVRFTEAGNTILETWL